MPEFFSREELLDGLPAKVKIHCGNQKQDLDLVASTGRAVLPINGRACQLKISFADKSIK